MTAQTTALHYLSLSPKDTAFWKLTEQSSPLQKAALIIVSIVAVPLEMIARCFYNAALWIYSNLCHRSILPAEVLPSRFSIPVTKTIAAAEQTIPAERLSEKDPLIPQLILSAEVFQPHFSAPVTTTITAAEEIIPQPILPAEVFQPHFSAPVTTTITAAEEIIPQPILPAEVFQPHFSAPVTTTITAAEEIIPQPLSKEPEEIDFHFDADYFPDTNKETIAPVSATELFYQQKQIATFCSIHCLCNFAGRNIDQLVPTLIQTNNEYLCDSYKSDWQMTTARALESVKQMGLYLAPSLQAIATMGGTHGIVITQYMKQHKSNLNLPESCEIQTVAGLPDSDQIKTAINKIQTDPHLHRVIVSVENSRYAHISAIRKDDAGQWRVLDSIQDVFVTRSQLQPSFPTLQEAVDNLMVRHGGLNHSIDLIYPSIDTPGIALKIKD